MKKSILLAASLLALTLTPVFGQPNPNGTLPSGPDFQQRLKEIVNSANAAPALTKFNLDFPSGTPAQLVKTIEKAMGKPLNAIILTEDADLQMPPLKMNDVTVPQLFAALKAASQKNVAYQTSGSGNSYSTYGTDYGFTTADGPITDTTIWYFRVQKPSLPPVVSTQKNCQFYSLAPYLDRGFTVDDITTAIQTGWKMAGVTPTPELNYHKETKMLIAFGEPNNLQTIQQVLQTLPTANQEVWKPMNDRIRELQTQVDQLKKQLHLPPSVISPEEKSGK